jgi:peptidoglycan-associated lipoprotein
VGSSKVLNLYICELRKLDNEDISMKKIIFVLLLAFAIAGCAERVKPEDDMAIEDAGFEGGATATGIDSGTGMQSETLEGGRLVSYEEGAIDDPNNVLSDKVIYFAFDSNTVGDEYVELVKHHGKYLAFNANASVRLEGHADERGTREYNVALAEARAQAVKQLMLYEGAGNDQITVISYGEEKPVAFGHDEESMSLNRRVEIVYQ